MKFLTTSMEDSFTQRLNENTAAKDKIARCAISMIETGRSMFFDSGTTMLRMAHLLPDERLTITTTGPNIALELLNKSLPIINLVGGMVNRDNISISGTPAMEFLNSINIDIAFIVPSGFSSKNGLTSGNYSECELKKLIVQKARRVIVLMDASKLDKSLPYTFCGIEDLDTIITDAPLPEDITRQCEAAGVDIKIAT